MTRKKEIYNLKPKMPKFRFTAMSKLIGLIAFGFVFIITIYAMMEMHNTGNYDSLPQLIISAFGFASVYSGFYLTMAKVEHVEAEKTTREKELSQLKKTASPEEEINEKRMEIESLRQKMNDLLSETAHSLL